MSDTSDRTVSRRSFLTSTGIAGAVALAGCTEGPGESATPGSELSGSISITGSSTVYPVAQAVTEQFRQEHSDVDFNLARTGTGGGFSNQFCPGNSDFNNASRPISSEEEQSCSENGVEYHEINIATDALTVIVNNDNDWVDCMTPDQLRQIWRADGYFGFSFYQSNSDAVKALSIDDGEGCVAPSLDNAKNGDYQPLSRPLFTYVNTASLAEEHIAEFARFYVEQSANQELVSGIGYVPKTEEDMQAELDALEQVISEAQ